MNRSPQDAEFFPAVYPIPDAVDNRLRGNAWNRQMAYPLEAMNESELLQASLITGQPGYDYTNPNAFYSAQVLVLSDFEFAYSRTRAQTPNEVSANVVAGGGILDVGP